MGGRGKSAGRNGEKIAHPLPRGETRQMNLPLRGFDVFKATMWWGVTHSQSSTLPTLDTCDRLPDLACDPFSPVWHNPYNQQIDGRKRSKMEEVTTSRKFPLTAEVEGSN